MVVSNRLCDKTGASPVFNKAKQPVPYVDLIMPGAKHACPINAAC